MHEQKITADMVINEVIQRYPWTLPVFHRYEVDSCCGGAQTIEFAVRTAGLDLIEVMAELEAAAESSQA